MNLGCLVQFCETACVRQCCGFEAFEFSEQRIREYLGERLAEDRPAIVKDLDEVLLEIDGQPETEVSVLDLEITWTKADAVAFFAKLRAMLEKMS